MHEKIVAVVLPGLDGTGTLLKRFSALSPSRYRTRVVSYPVDRRPDYEELVTFVEERLPRRRPFVLIAESFSGPVAVGLASRRFDHLKGVVLAATFVTPPGPVWWRLLPWTALFRLPIPIGLAGRFLLGADADGLKEAVDRVEPRVLAGRVRSALGIDARRQLAGVTCPLLYIRAERDRVVGTRCLREILSIRPDMKVESVDAPHLVLQHAPEKVWGLVQRFFRDSSAHSRAGL